MSMPSFVAAFKNEEQVSITSINWGWVSPTHYEVAIQIIKVVSNNYEYVPGYQQKFAADWDYLVERCHGKMTRKNYELMYNEAKLAHEGKVQKSDFNVLKYFEAK